MDILFGLVRIFSHVDVGIPGIHIDCTSYPVNPYFNTKNDHAKKMACCHKLTSAQF